MNLNKYFKTIDGKDETKFTDEKGNEQKSAKMNQFVGNVIYGTPTTKAEDSLRLFILAQKIYQWKDIKSITNDDIKLIKEVVSSRQGLSISAMGQIMQALDEK